MENNTNQNISQEKEIDLLDLAKKLWAKRKFIVKCSCIGLIVGIVIAFSIPKEYQTTVILAPESNNSGTAGNMGALAAMAGINIGGQQQDVLASPDIFPTLLKSTPFITGLFDVKIADAEKDIDTTLYSYLKDDQSRPWWGYILGVPSKIIGVFSSNNNYQVESRVLDGSLLTREQLNVFENLKGRINISIEKKTGIITLTSLMQSSQISAYVADTVTSYLQDYIIKYRTEKARQDLAFTERLYNEAKNDYYKAQQNYATYSDENLNVISARYRTTQERLQNEMSLAYGVYNQMAQQLQMAKVKVQDTTPVYTIIQPAVRPLIPIKPNKKLIVASFILFFGIGACSYIIGKDFLKEKI
jgi:capsular polysaccharide biosynthesis protein